MINQLMTELSNRTKSKKILTEQGDDYTTGWLLGFGFFEENYRLIVADLSK